jgi:uncharacterized protein (TIGR02118 family)
MAQVTVQKDLVAAVVSYPSLHPDTKEPLKFDMTYYLSTHMPLIHKAWSPFGMKSWSINQFASPDALGQTPPYGVQTTIYWEKEQDFVDALNGPMREECSEDVKKFSNIYPSIWIGGIVKVESY